MPMLPLVERSAEIDALINNHSYELSSLTQSYKDQVMKYKKTCLHFSHLSREMLKIREADRHPVDERPFALENLKFPGVASEDAKVAKKYYMEAYNRFEDSNTPPRGYIGKDATVVCGIAPGYSELSFGESAWMFGPSSKVLHELLGFDYRWYFTNVCKSPFLFNRYNDEVVDGNIDLLVDELRFFKHSLVVFLGSYDVYKKVAEEAHLRKHISIQHPSYIARSGNAAFDMAKQKLMKYVKPVMV